MTVAVLKAVFAWAAIIVLAMAALIYACLYISLTIRDWRASR